MRLRAAPAASGAINRLHRRRCVASAPGRVRSARRASRATSCAANALAAKSRIFARSLPRVAANGARLRVLPLHLLAMSSGSSIKRRSAPSSRCFTLDLLSERALGARQPRADLRRGRSPSSARFRDMKAARTAAQGSARHRAAEGAAALAARPRIAVPPRESAADLRSARRRPSRLREANSRSSRSPRRRRERMALRRHAPRRGTARPRRRRVRPRGGVRTHENFLRHVFGFVAVARDAVRDRDDARVLFSRRAARTRPGPDRRTTWQPPCPYSTAGRRFVTAIRYL